MPDFERTPVDDRPHNVGVEQAAGEVAVHIIAQHCDQHFGSVQMDAVSDDSPEQALHFAFAVTARSMASCGTPQRAAMFMHSMREVQEPLRSYDRTRPISSRRTSKSRPHKCAVVGTGAPISGLSSATKMTLSGPLPLTIRWTA